MCTIGVLQSGQNRISSGTIQSTLLMGRDSYRALRTDLGFDVRVCAFTSVDLAGSVSSSSSAVLSALGSFSLEMPNSFRFFSCFYYKKETLVCKQTVFRLRHFDGNKKCGQPVLKQRFIRSETGFFQEISTFCSWQDMACRYLQHTDTGTAAVSG